MSPKTVCFLVASLTLASGCQSTEKEAVRGQTTQGETQQPQGLSLHSWNSYHWARQATPIPLKIGDNLTTVAWKGHLARTSGDWNNPAAFGATSTPLTTTIVAGPSSKRCSMVPGTVQVCNGNYGKNGWLGLASINISGGHITQGTAKMNDSYFGGATYDNPNEKLHVMCQELAHTFGLDHQSVDGSSQNSCMDYFSNTGVNAGSALSTTPNAHDFEELNLVYVHLDTTTTVAATTATTTATIAAAADAVTHEPKSWGDLKAQNKSGKGSVYERTLPDGSVSLTHVYWTDEVAAKCASCDHRNN